MAEKFAEIIDFGGDAGERTVRDKYARADINVLMDALTKTASGNPVVISDCAGGKARSLITEINAIQDLHGLPFPYVGGAYKNKLPNLYTSKSSAGIDYDVYDNGAVHVHGTSTNISAFSLGTFNLNDNSYIINGCPSGGGSSTYELQVVTSDNITYRDYGSGASFSANGSVTGQILVRNGVTIDKVFYPMIRLSTESDASFAPYSNICPISGRTEAVLTRSKYGLSFVQGGLQDNTGAEVESNSRIRTDYIPFTDSSFTLSMENGENDDVLRNSIYLYDAQKHFIATKQYGLNPSTFPVNVNIDIPTNTAYMRFVVQKSDATANISPSNRVMTVNPTNFTIQLGQTVYGADINWDTGVMTVKTAKIDLGSLDYLTATVGSVTFYYADVPNAPHRDYTAISSDYPVTNDQTEFFANDGIARAYGTTSYGGFARVGIIDSRYDGYTTAQFKEAMSGVDYEYELATPTTIQLTPTQLEMLKGYNRVTIEGGSIELGYIAKLT